MYYINYYIIVVYHTLKCKINLWFIFIIQYDLQFILKAFMGFTDIYSCFD